MVERLQARHYRFSDAGRFHFVAKRFHLPLDAAHKSINSGGVDFALAAGMADRPRELVTVERLALAVFLDYRQVAELDTLEGCESGTARFALSPPANSRSVFGGAAILNLAVFMGAKGTTHQL